MVAGVGSSRVFAPVFRWARRGALATAVVVAVSVVQFVPAQAAPMPSGPGAATERSVPVKPVKPAKRTSAETDGAALKAVDRKVLPSAGSSDVPVSGETTEVGDLPVSFAPEVVVDDASRRSLAAATGPDSVTARVVDEGVARAAGVPGVVVALSRSDGVARSGPARMSVEYGRFANAFGADYGQRLRLVSLPGCVLETPTDPLCQVQTPLDSVNRSGVVSGTVTVGGDPAASVSASSGVAPMVVALSSTAESAGGTFTATSLSETYEWSAGGQGGDFGYSYPFEMPPSSGGLQPNLALRYSSGSVDGQTLARNGQASWVGEGWDLQVGYVERSYRSCADDGGTTGDLCWFSSYNATLVLNGSSTRLVRDAATGVWKGAEDNGLKIELLSDLSLGNGDNDGEYWRVTTQDGTQYYFGRHKRSAGDVEPQWSVSSVPVFGNNLGEPCYSADGFAASSCLQGYRWHLDYVTDAIGNSMTYYYNRFSGNYGANNNTAAAPYDMASYLHHVDYGTRAGFEGPPAPLRVDFERAPRCVGACALADYPDTPWDLHCGTSSCPNTKSPAFWGSDRLASVTTKAWNSSAGAYRAVDRWDLAHSYPASGDFISPAGNDTSPNLWLESVTHTGFAPDGTTGLAEPAVSFGGVRMSNRVDWGNDIGVAPYMHYRINLIRNGVGGETLVSYAGEGCVRTVRPNPHANPTRCFPQVHKPVSMPAGYGWFHKYVVTQVTERDTTGGSPDQVTSYAYSTEGSTDSSLWAHDRNEVAVLANRTWSVWRGYTTVTTTKGAAGGPQTSSRAHYYRGMNGDGMPTTDNSAMAWGTRRAGITTPLITPGFMATVSGQGGQCLDVANAGTANGTNVQMQACNGHGAQVWQTRYPSNDEPYFLMYNPLSNKCLDVFQFSTANGADVNIWDCANTVNQRWLRQPNGSLLNPASGRCLDIVNVSTVPETPVQLWDCANAWSQMWQPQANGSLVSPQGMRCMDAAGTGDGTPVRSYQCNGAASQLWQPWLYNTLSSGPSGKCLDVTGGGTANGSPVQLWTCNGQVNQVWQPQPNGSLLNPQSGRCLDAGPNPRNGVQLYLWDCTGSITQSWAHQITDQDGLEGRPMLEVSLDGPTVLGASLHVYSVTQTGLRPNPNPAGEDVTARMSRENYTWERTWLPDSGTWRWSVVAADYDSYGLPVRVNDHGDMAVATDDRCSHYAYARNTDRWIVDTVSYQGTDSKNCAAAPTYPQDLVAEEVTSYDGQAFGVAPTRGLVTRTEEVASRNGTASTYVTTMQSTHDEYGRPRTATDALNRTTETSYNPSTGVPSMVTVTNPAGHVTTTHLDPRRGLTLGLVDPNNKTTAAQYDPLGRLTKVWYPGRATNQTPDTEYVYTVSQAARHVETKTLAPNGNQVSSFTIYDGLLQPRQNQNTTPSGTRAITDTQYDSRGLTVKQATVHNAAAPSGTLLAFSDADTVSQSRFTYDGAGRLLTDQFWSNNTFKWQSITSYRGDRTHTDPPDGAVATTAINDVRGRTTALRQYHGTTNSGAYDETTYEYDPSDQLTKVTDPAGNNWTYQYDLRGRQIGKTDPDAGTSTSTYDAAGQLLTTTDSRGETLARIYDNLGRIKELRDDSATGALRTSYVYDTLAKGQATSSTRHVGAAAYTTAVTGYTDRYQPTGSSITIPAVEGNLAGTYTSTSTYLPTGALATSILPATGGLAAETLTYGYSQAGLATTMASATTTYVAATNHHWQGELQEQVLGAAGKRVWLGYGLDDATRRLTGIRVQTENQTTPGTWTNRAGADYSHDPAGNITSIAGDTNGIRDQVECYRYDYHRRLTDAWSQADVGCSTPQRAGADAYRLAWTYDLTGNRKTQTSWSATGTTTATSSYPTPGANQPHTLNQVAYTGETTRTDTYTYDTAGNTTTRPVSGVTQTLTWDEEGHLATTSQTSQNTSYLYDTEGNRLIRRDATGATLYLGGTELRLKTNGQVDGTRYYSHNGTTIAVRNVTGLTWLAADHHGTSQLTVDPDTLNVTRRRSKPFGEPRGPQPGSWPSEKGFVGGTQDPTGLTHLGAREYDPTTGRFISVDPITDHNDPQQVNGYAYAYNSPVTFTDPDGLKPLITETAAGDEQHYRDTGEKFVKTSSGKWGVVKDKVKPKSPPTKPGPKKPDPKTDGPSNADIAKAKEIKKTSVVDVVVRAAGSLLLDFLGVTDIMGCIGGDLTSCAMALINLLPPGKVARALFKSKAILNRLQVVGTAIKKWDESVAWANKVLKRGCNSFLPGTAVLMADGSTKPIEDVDIGDEVVATDPETGETRAKQVTDTIIGSGGKDLVVVSIDIDGDRGRAVARITATDEHPFWDDQASEWVNAEDLRPDDVLLTPQGERVRVQTVVSYHAIATVYNLTVADIHTYYVAAGDTQVLVHNADECKVVDLTLGAGPNAREGVALVDGNINAPGVRELVNESGAANGCHTCPARVPGTRSGNWIPDHQPPTKSVSPGSPHTAYPHCLPCARSQAGTVTQLNRGNFEFDPE
ncbi:ricin-type beta-trefoil lectin domain protein [Micromonospora sp. NPDC049523]|uniref:ricin-type beta-trefoil lectin domain protein n=1 Tax=Micromonospora sp. NPDC049523 TaxID=3155921 RepID=UPI0034335B88